MSYWIGKGVLKTNDEKYIERGGEFKKDSIHIEQYNSLQKKGLVTEKSPEKTAKELDEIVERNKRKVLKEKRSVEDIKKDYEKIQKQISKLKVGKDDKKIEELEAELEKLESEFKGAE